MGMEDGEQADRQEDGGENFTAWRDEKCENRTSVRVLRNGRANRDSGRTGKTAGGLDRCREYSKGNIIPCYVAFYV